MYFLLVLLLAQTFPLTVSVVWDKNPVGDNVTQYNVVHNGVSYIILAESCTFECRQPITLTHTGPHTVSVTSTNFWGTSVPVTLTFTVQIPGKSGNIRIRVGN